jgi:hypothetical protein
MDEIEIIDNLGTVRYRIHQDNAVEDLQKCVHPGDPVKGLCPMCGRVKETKTTDAS